LSLGTGLGPAFFQLRALDAPKDLLDATIAAYEKSLTLTQNRYNARVAPRAHVLQGRTPFGLTQSQAVGPGGQRAQFEHAHALLVGEPRASLSMARSPLAGEPPPIPVTLPSALLERRPDVAGAARRVASANAQIGVAQAAYYPAITLSASGGFESSE